jgi:hypothetical protein
MGFGGIVAIAHSHLATVLFLQWGRSRGSCGNEERHKHTRLIVHIRWDFREFHFAIAIDTLDRFEHDRPSVGPASYQSLLPKASGLPRGEYVQGSPQWIAHATPLFRKFTANESRKYLLKGAPSDYPRNE